jgi:hypothetical protein
MNLIHIIEVRARDVQNKPPPLKQLHTYLSSYLHPYLPVHVTNQTQAPTTMAALKLTHTKVVTPVQHYIQAQDSLYTGFLFVAYQLQVLAAHQLQRKSLTLPSTEAEDDRRAKFLVNHTFDHLYALYVCMYSIMKGAESCMHDVYVCAYVCIAS